MRTPANPNQTRLRAIWCWGLVLLVTLSAQASEPGSGTGIFVCVDGQGRRITSDRPIPECAAREQREVTAAGTVRRVIAPQLTPEERAQAEQRAAADSAQRARDVEQQRKDRALLARYPSQPPHDAERQRQLALLNDATLVLNRRGEELRQAGLSLEQEMEFYKSNPAKAPAWLTRKQADHAEQLQRHQQALRQQQEEQLRLHQRFDEELLRLKQLWAASRAASNR